MYHGETEPTQKQELGYLPGKQGFLRPEEWHDRAPFWVRRTKDVDWVEHPKDAGPLWFNYPFRKELKYRTYDQEVRFAANAGIDFFIHNEHGLVDHQMKSSVPEAKTLNFVALFWGFIWQGEFNQKKLKGYIDKQTIRIQHPNWQTVVMYSWNEFSEGGALCPTMGTSPEYIPVTTLFDEAAEALKEWKYEGRPNKSAHPSLHRANAVKTG